MRDRDELALQLDVRKTVKWNALPLRSLDIEGANLFCLERPSLRPRIRTGISRSPSRNSVTFNPVNDA